MTSVADPYTGFGENFALTNDSMIYEANDRLMRILLDGSRGTVQLADRSLGSYQVTPDKEAIIYQTSAGEIFKYSLTDDTEIRLSLQTASQEDISRDGSRLILVRSGDFYGLRTDGLNEAIRLTFDDLKTGGHALSPDGRYLVFFATKPGSKEYHLYSVPTDGSSPPIQLIEENTDEIEFAWVSANSKNVIFRVYQDTEKLIAYTILIDGIEERKLFDATYTPQKFLEARQAVAPIVIRQAYFQNIRFSEQANEQYLDTSFLRLLGAESRSWYFSLDGRFVVFYVRDQQSTYTLYSLRLDRESTPVKLADSLALPENWAGYDAYITEDSQHVVYNTLNTAGDGVSLLSVPVDGSSEPILLSENLTNPSRVSYVFWVGDFVVYSGRYDYPGQSSFILYAVPIKGGTPFPINETPADFAWLAPDDRTILYSTGYGTDRITVYSAHCAEFEKN